MPKNMTMKLFKTEASGKSVKCTHSIPVRSEQTSKDEGACGIEHHRRLEHGGEANQDTNQATSASTSQNDHW